MDVSNKTKIGALLIAGLVVSVIALYVKEFHWLGNTFNARILVFWSLGIGLVLGIIVSQFLTKKVVDSYDKMRISVLIIFLATLFAPLFGSLSNRYLSFKEVQKHEFSFFAEKPIADLQIVSTENVKPEAYFVFFMKDGTVERVRSRKKLYDGKKKGTIIQLPIKKGLWGFEVVCLD